VGIVLVAGCLIVCGGLAAVGLFLPMRQRQAAARQAEQNAAEISRGARAAAAKDVESPAKEATAGPDAAEAPANDNPQAEGAESDDHKPPE
jgi:hypothetical protein